MSGIETNLNVIPASLLGTEIRNLNIKNKKEEDVELEVIGYFRPVLSKMEDDISHASFNNLFLKYSRSKDGDLIVRRNKRGNTREMYLGTNMFQGNDENKEIDYEIDNNKFVRYVKNREEFSNELGLVTEGCIALKTNVKIKAKDECDINLVICACEDEEKVLDTLSFYRTSRNIKQEFNIARAKAEEEARYLNLTKNEIIVFNKILPYILHQNPMKKLYMENLKGKIYKQSDFWKYGISGDNPIILVSTKSANDIYVVKEILKVHEILKVKGIKTDLCILDYEKNIYEQYVKDQIIQEILDMQIGYEQNIDGGIFLLNVNEIEDEDLFRFKANIEINASNGSLSEALKEMEEEYTRSIKNIGQETKGGFSDELKSQVMSLGTIKPNIDLENLKFYNGFGGFSEDGKEYIMRLSKDLKLPATWSNVLANENFGTVITSNLGEFTYSKNSRLGRITAWEGDPTDHIPSEIIYIKDLDFGNSWTMNPNVMPDNEDYYLTYGFGYARAYHASLGLIQEMDIFVPRNDRAKVNIIRLKNTLSEKRKVKLIYYIKPVLGEEETKTSGYIDLKLDKDKNILHAKNLYGEGIIKNVYVASSEKITSYTGNKLEFVGMRKFKYARCNKQSKS